MISATRGVEIMTQREYQVGDRIHFYLPADDPKRVKPRMGTIVERIGIATPETKVYAIVREDRSIGTYGEYVIALPR